MLLYFFLFIYLGHFLARLLLPLNKYETLLLSRCCRLNDLHCAIWESNELGAFWQKQLLLCSVTVLIAKVSIEQ